MSCNSSFKLSGCKPAASKGASLSILVHSYKIHNQSHLRNQLEFFRNLPSFDIAIHHAAYAIDCRKKRYDHQRRIKLNAMDNAKRLLVGASSHLKACRSFDKLLSLLSGMFAPVSGLGPLYIYDTALRLGSYLKRSPEVVYLHAGTHVGARSLGLDCSTGFLPMKDFDKAIQALTPQEIEDFLCIYKTALEKL